MKARLLSLLLLVTGVSLLAVANLGALEKHPVLANGTEGNGGSDRPSLSQDGRYLAFQSSSNNLGGNASFRDIYLVDRMSNTIDLITLDTNGEATDGFSNSPTISGNGSKIVFSSSATDLVAGDGNASTDVFLYDVVTEEISRVSVDKDGNDGDDDSFSITISRNGSWVAFTSRATDMVDGDSEGFSDVFMEGNGVRTRVTETATGVGGDGVSGSQAFSTNGEVLVFLSRARNLVPGTLSWDKVIVYDRLSDSFELASVDSNKVVADADCQCPAVSGDGSIVAFYSAATNLVSGDTKGFNDIFVRDRTSGETERISVNPGGEGANGDSFSPRISEDGRHVAFYSSASDLVPNDNNNQPDLFIYDRHLKAIFRASASDAGIGGNGAASLFLDFSGDASTSRLQPMHRILFFRMATIIEISLWEIILS